MSTLLLAPHGDDESLFAAYTVMQEQATVVACTTRRTDSEFSEALWSLQVRGETLPILEGELAMAPLADLLTKHYPGPYRRIYVPRVEWNGHEEHNIVSAVAEKVYDQQLHYYLTYAPRGERSRDGQLVPASPDMVARKLRALSCYRSQIANPQTQPWFFGLLDMREWVA